MTANIIFDLIIALLLVAGFIFGVTKGFVKTVAKPVKFFASLAIAFSCASPVGNALIFPAISAPITNKFRSVLVEKCASFTAGVAAEELPTIVKLAAGLCGIDIGELTAGVATESIADTIADALTTPVVTILSGIIAFVILYFVSKILLGIAVSIINAIVDNGFVGVLNRILGCVFGVALAMVVAWALTAVTDFAIHLPALAEVAWVKEFTGGFIYNFFKNVSPIDLILSF